MAFSGSKTNQLIGSGASLIGIADIMQPLAPATNYILAISLISLFFLFLIKYFNKNFSNILTELQHLMISIFIFSLIFCFLQMQNENNKKFGVIASHIPAISNLQKSLSIVTDRLKNIDQTATSIDKKMDNVKKETSENPQKELSNLGVPWTDDAYAQALMRSDVKIVNLFLQAGWNPLSNYDGGNALGNYVWLGDMSDPKDVETILSLMIKHGVSLTEPISRFRGVKPQDLVASSIRACNLTFLKITLAHGGKINNPSLEMIRLNFEKLDKRICIMGADDSSFSTRFKADTMEILRLIRKFGHGEFDKNFIGFQQNMEYVKRINRYK